LVKKKARKPERKVTRHQLSQWQRQKKRQRIILILGITIIVVVLGIMVGGWFTSYYQPLHQTAIRVNDTEFDMRYYIESLRFQTQGKPEYTQYMADIVVRNIEQDELIRQEALKLGISVSDEEVKEELKKSDLPNKDVYRNLIGSQMLVNKLRDEYFEQQVPTSAQQRQVMVMLLESKPQAADIRARLESGESFTELAEEFSLDTMAKTNKGDYGWHPEEVLMELFSNSTTPAEYAFLFDVVGKLSQPLYDEEVDKGVGYWLLRVLDVDEEAEEAHVYAMLLGSELEAKEVRARLEAGEDFAALAKEYSQLPGVEENEGNLGMVVKGDKPSAFDEFVFSPELELGALSEPIRDDTVSTRGGYWLVKVVAEDDDRQIEDEDRDMLIYKALREWVASLWLDPANEVDHSYLDDVKKAWAVEQALKE